MSGLFDKGAAGEARLSSAEYDDLLTLDTADLLSTFDKDLLGMEGFDDLDKVTPADDTDFMEVFTDLSEMLGGVPGGLDSPLVPAETFLDSYLTSIQQAEVSSATTEGVRVQKRTANVLTDPTTPLSNPDHDDYTKRPRVATADSTSEMGSVSEELVPNNSNMEPQPSTSNATPQTKYIERRIKNNIASRRSRQTRKQKFAELEVQEEQLELANEKLRKQVEELEKLTKVMKDMLVQKLAKAS